jgi:hypothetical protein
MAEYLLRGLTETTAGLLFENSIVCLVVFVCFATSVGGLPVFLLMGVVFLDASFGVFCL